MRTDGMGAVGLYRRRRWAHVGPRQDRGADAQALLSWGENLLDAEKLEQVFGGK